MAMPKNDDRYGFSSQQFLTLRADLTKGLCIGVYVVEMLFIHFLPEWIPFGQLPIRHGVSVCVHTASTRRLRTKETLALTKFLDGIPETANQHGGIFVGIVSYPVFLFGPKHFCLFLKF